MNRLCIWPCWLQLVACMCAHNLRKWGAAAVSAVFSPEVPPLGIWCLSRPCFCTWTMDTCAPNRVGLVLIDRSLQLLHLLPLGRCLLQLFSEVQEKAIEEQMVAVKDVVMEPTMKTLSDDLVRSRGRPHAC